MDGWATLNIKNQPKLHLSTPCIICGESIPLNDMEELALDHGHHIHGKVCDKCKAAILYIREQMS